MFHQLFQKYNWLFIKDKILFVLMIIDSVTGLQNSLTHITYFSVNQLIPRTKDLELLPARFREEKSLQSEDETTWIKDLYTI
jgi:hypothetical protein